MPVTNLVQTKCDNPGCPHEFTTAQEAKDTVFPDWFKTTRLVLAPDARKLVYCCTECMMVAASKGLTEPLSPVS
jgi:hypothetical protein